MDQSEKCQHGVYRAGQPVARFCSLCNPNTNDRTLVGLPKWKPAKSNYTPEPVLHVDEFLLQPVGVRLAEMRNYE